MILGHCTATVFSSLQMFQILDIQTLEGGTDMPPLNVGDQLPVSRASNQHSTDTLSSGLVLANYSKAVHLCTAIILQCRCDVQTVWLTVPENPGRL
jgi:hypothetical protein